MVPEIFKKEEQVGHNVLSPRFNRVNDIEKLTEGFIDNAYNK